MIIKFKHVKIITATLASSLVLILAACGGGSDGGGGESAGSIGSTANQQLGVFSDAPVVGLNYTTSSNLSGTTNTLGQFTFASGDSVTFRVGGITLGSVTPSVAFTGNATVTPVRVR